MCVQLNAKQNKTKQRIVQRQVVVVLLMMLGVVMRGTWVRYLGT